ncbi:MAG: thymidine kinase [Pseudomonadota bacterium]|nr:thymidine kinase [Pseudomonadota bacterium]
MSKLYFTYSAMNAGKSAILLQAAYNYRERGMEVMLWTSGHYGANAKASQGKIESRIGLEADANLYRDDTDLFAAIERQNAEVPLSAIFFDEAQFLTKAQVWQLARVGDRLKLPILCYGLRTDFQGELFEGSAALLAIADDLREARTICFCGKKATMTARMDEQGNVLTSGNQVSVGKEVYVSFCRSHWEEALGR